METQQGISAERLQRKVGSVIEVLIDEVDNEGAIGRSSADAPEIDGNVFLDGVFDLQPGDLVKARVVEAEEYDLVAELVV